MAVASTTFWRYSVSVPIINHAEVDILKVGGIGTFDKSMKCAAFGGLIAIIGMVSGVRAYPNPTMES
jgi:hypothetical protein